TVTRQHRIVHLLGDEEFGRFAVRLQHAGGGIQDLCAVHLRSASPVKKAAPCSISIPWLLHTANWGHTARTKRGKGRPHGGFCVAWFSNCYLDSLAKVPVYNRDQEHNARTEDGSFNLI